MAIELSPSALEEVKRLRTTQQRSDACFRLTIESGGCNGLLYAMRFDETIAPDDRVYELEGIQMVVDAQSLPYVEGMNLDYSEDLMGGGFRFHNPNAVQSCGCGNSFSISQFDSAEDGQG